MLLWISMMRVRFSSGNGGGHRPLDQHLSRTAGGCFGGDSSTIAALAARHGKINVQHFHTRSLMGDERQYAGAMASYLDLPLPMQLCDAGEVTIHETFSAHRPRPSSRVFTQIFDKYSAARVKIIGASAHFNGGGGDSVFGKLHSAYPLADRYLATGMSRALWTTALDICGATGASLKDVLRQAIRAARGRDMLAPWPLQTDLLTPRAIEIGGMEVHPWFAAAQGAHPGQRQHIRSIVRATATTDYLNICDTVPTIYPLLSQPIVELCLSFPTWFWFRGARDRSLARTALEAYLPRNVLDRTVKGAFDGLLHEIVDRHRQEIIPELENGILVEQGLVDRAAITALRSGSQRTTVTRLLHLHEVQTWCLAWMG
jgi:asparagine synthase (glutamine-hydrolysing)